MKNLFIRKIFYRKKLRSSRAYRKLFKTKQLEKIDFIKEKLLDQRLYGKSFFQNFFF